MKLAIMTPYIGNFGDLKYYNSQDTGLAKKLSKKFDKVTIIRLHNRKINPKKEIINISDKVNIISLPAKCFGHHGIIDPREISFIEFDKILIFSDNQIIIPRIHKFLKVKNKEVIYYVGVLKSNSNNLIKKIIINILMKRNLKCYKDALVVSKTPNVMEQLKNLGIKNAKLLPVGLDEDLLFKNYKQYNKSILRKQFGIDENSKVILFIGRLEDEKRPLDLIKIFKDLNSKNQNYKLLIIGKGNLKNTLLELIKKYDLQNKVMYIESVPNKDIWKYYCVSDLFLNLNRNEIFGMAILEAMYYECPVIAHVAPGPNFIIDNFKNGILINNDNDIYKNIVYIERNKETIISNAKSKLEKHFMWNINNIID